MKPPTSTPVIEMKAVQMIVESLIAVLERNMTPGLVEAVKEGLTPYVDEPTILMGRSPEAGTFGQAARRGLAMLDDLQRRIVPLRKH